MESEFILLTDMINAKMLGMFEIIDKWIPHQNTIKKMLLNDINFIEKEIHLFHNKQHSNVHIQHNNRKKVKCRNGNNCPYFQRGRCWFNHITSNTSDKTQQQEQQKHNNTSNKVDNNNRNKIKNMIVKNKNMNTMKKQKSKSSQQSPKTRKNAKSQQNSSNSQKQKKKKTRRRRKKKKFDIDTILQSFGYSNDSGSNQDISATTTTNKSGNIYIPIFLFKFEKVLFLCIQFLI